ncbi:MAG: CPBP family intramembrane metalloprotease [Lentisphaeria bacterium]|nr:CPBP family intramembrane metalloprotease [Lentisphaeria bacterium]
MNEKDCWLKTSSVILFAGGVLLILFSPIALIPQPDIRIVAALFVMPVFFLAAVLIPCGISHGKNFWNILELNSLKKSDIKPILSGVLVFILSGLLSFLWQKITGKITPQFLVSYAVSCPLWQFVLILISAGVLAPVAEELAFRRTIAGFIRTFITEDKFAVYLIPSLLFALSHGIIWQSVLLFFFALYLQWNQLSGSTARTICIHAVFNWCTLIILILMRAGILPENLQV